jgi:gliding motility-associated lipoprotein GldH
MKPIQYLIFLFLIIAQISCDQRKVHFKEHISFGEEMIWKQTDVKTFKIDVKENKHPYEMVIDFRYMTAYPYDKLLLEVLETKPNGEKIRHDVDILVRDSKGEFIGDKGLDIIDLEFIYDDNLEFPSFGTYTYEIRQVMPEIEILPGVMEIGMILRDKETK